MKKKLPVVLVLLLVISAATAFTCFARAQSSPRRIEVTAKRFSFMPDDITLKKGEAVILVLRSDDVAHGLRFRELNIDVKVGPHGTAEARFTPEKSGDFIGRCSVFCGSGHRSMVLTLHVVD
jgi:cytochrome c oxidase subunit 2